jgi:type IV secretory pathway protease TraF
MTVGLSGRVPKTLRAPLVAIVVSIAVFQLFGFLGLRINTSPSLPVGLYFVTRLPVSS